MLRIKKDDTVMVMKGRDRGKKGRVMKVVPAAMKAIVEGRNLVKKHVRRKRADQQIGIIQVESPMDMSNLMPVCPKCDKPVKVGFDIGKDGKKVRICRKCKEVLA